SAEGRVRCRLDIAPADVDQTFVRAATDQITWLLAQTEEQLWPRTIMRRILPVTEEELSRIVLDIHDGPVQYLFAALSQLTLLQANLKRGSSGRQVDEV